jgi:hypothetical protein
MILPIRDDDELPWPADPEREAATLTDLRAEFSGMHITADFFGTGRAWVAQGNNGHPWLVMSDDLARFRAALRDGE